MKRYIRNNNFEAGDVNGNFELFRLSLSKRSRNLIDRLGLKTVEDLKMFGLDNLKVQEGCGKKTHNEFIAEMEKLERLGIEGYTAASRINSGNGDGSNGRIDHSASLQLLIEEMAKSGYVNSVQAQKILGLNSISVRELLNLLVDKGYANREGSRRGMRYVRAV